MLNERVRKKERERQRDSKRKKERQVENNRSNQRHIINKTSKDDTIVHFYLRSHHTRQDNLNVSIIESQRQFHRTLTRV